MSDHTITACCLNMEALLREAVGLLPAEPDWKVRVIAELNRPPATPAAPPPGAGDGPYVAGTNCAGETAAQVANYILADLRVLFKGNQSGQSLCDAIGSAIVGALKESSAAGAASRDPEVASLAERVKVLDDLLVRARVFVEADVRMMEDISRHAPLPHDEQAKHNAMVDAGECLSQTLLDDIDAALNPPAQAGGGRAKG